MAISLDLGGSRALVTGGGSGIGQACAELLAESGASVVIADIDESAASKVASVITRGGLAAQAEQLDVTSVERCRELATRYTDARTIDVIVNCAASWTLGTFVDIEASVWQRDLDVSLKGSLIVTSAFLPAMQRLGRGSVINIGSDAGRIGEPGQVAYSAAKAGIGGFTKALAKEVGRDGIRVNCISPGLTNTPASAAYIADISPEVVRRKYPLGRIGEPSDIAGLVVFLASGRASWITGQVISVSGGYTTVG